MGDGAMKCRRPAVKYLGRRLLDGPYLTLCQSQRAFHREARVLDPDCERIDFINPGASATTHFFTTAKGFPGLVAIVCIDVHDGKRTPAQVIALLAHEATHVWQRFCRKIGEDCPGTEIEAYAIQSITQELVDAYRPRLQFATTKARR